MYIVHIKEKENQYIRFIISSYEKNFFKEKYFPITEWNEIEKIFLEIRSQINTKIRNNIFPKNDFKMLENEVKFFVNSKLELPVEKTFLKVIWNGNIFIPFEIIREFNVINMIDSSYKQYKNKNKITLIYSDEAGNSRFEVYKLAELFKKRKEFSLTYFDEKSFSFHKSEICESALVHISTHGKAVDRNCLINIGGEWIKSFDFKLNANFLFLNCCEAGLYPNGVVKNSIDSGVKYLIASPYEIFDNVNWKIKTIKFYENFNFNNIESSFFEYKNKNYLFGLFFRFFMAI